MGWVRTDAGTVQPSAPKDDRMPPRGDEAMNLLLENAGQVPAPAFLLGDWLKITGPDLLLLVNELRHLGYVKAEGPNGQPNFLSLTPKGLSRLAAQKWNRLPQPVAEPAPQTAAQKLDLSERELAALEFLLSSKGCELGYSTLRSYVGVENAEWELLVHRLERLELIAEHYAPSWTIYLTGRGKDFMLAHRASGKL